MNQPDAQTAPNYVTCPCQHCSGKIEFDSNELDPAENTTVPCPHCGFETTIFVPEQKVPPVVSEDIPVRFLYDLNDDGQEGENAKRQTDLGIALLYGHGMDKNEVEGFKRLKVAAQQEFAEAQYFIGHCYLKGLGVEKDEAKALEWFLKAAEQGHVMAQFFSGLYENEKSNAAGWLLKAAEQGLTEAEDMLGRAYFWGEGVPASHAEAYKWYSRATKKRFGNSSTRLGTLLLERPGRATEFCRSI